ncbi:MAG: quinolinate synthase NadA [DPANN group archaeon]|nr:quinolinate synthase NadA [DPANN group archaeon]
MGIQIARHVLENVNLARTQVIQPSNASYVAGLLQQIEDLKQELNAVIPAHYYQRQEVKWVADFIGDSLELAKKSKETTAGTIVFAGVTFMAETAKLLNPDKTVLVPNLQAGCSLADSITAGQLRYLREKYPDAAVVAYVNTTAAVKAESDVCCTSANYEKIIRALPQKQIIFVPDTHMAQNLNAKIKAETGKEIIGWSGECIVHKQFGDGQIKAYKQAMPDLKVLVHIECPTAVVGSADYAGSTSGIRKYVRENPQQKYFLVLTECGMIGDLQTEFPDRNFETPCTICQYMKEITLENILQSLQTGQHEIKIDEKIAARARKSLERMFEIG